MSNNKTRWRFIQGCFVILNHMRFIAISFPLLVLHLLSGCASFMHMPELPGQGEEVKIGNITVNVVDLDARNVNIFTPPRATIPRQLLEGTAPGYKIGPFDVLIITIWDHPELTLPLGQYRNDLASGQLVDADGTFFFPFMGRVKVVGMTTTELQSLITRDLAKVLKDPQVDVKISAFRSQRVFVSGHVRQPGMVAIEDMPMNLAELLDRVGGILPTGDPSGVQLVRDGRTYELDVEGLQEAGAHLDSIRLHPGDQIRVPAATDRVVYVLGEVATPGMVPLINGRLSLVRGLTQVGGFNTISANSAGVYVMRAKDSAKVTVYRLDGSSPVALAFAGQFQLRPRDLVYVDQSGLSRWSRVFQQLVPIAGVINSTVATGTGSSVNLQTLKENW
ncbi:MAG: hypothetical protein RL173_493 [Fibrobacterota bacterium]|jgi:polysaccharide export outer membrane protein